MNKKILPMSDTFQRYGITLAPSSVITTLLLGALNAWTYDYRKPQNELRNRSLQLRNLADEALGKYKVQLSQELSRLRKLLPEPTRENSDPPMEGLAAVKALDAYIRSVESLRVRVQGAAIPPQEFVHHSQAGNQILLTELQNIDSDILRVLSELTPSTIEQVTDLLANRDDLLSQFQKS